MSGTPVDIELLPDGNCLICGRHLGRQAYREQRVMAIYGGGVTLLWCVDHVKPGCPDLRVNREKIVLALIAQRQKS